MKHSLLHSSLSVLIVAALGGSAAPAQSTTRVSVDSAGLQTKDGSQPPMISADGRFVTFSSHATNLVIGDTNGKFDVFVHDRQTGQTTRVSVDSGGFQSDLGSGSCQCF